MRGPTKNCVTISSTGLKQVSVNGSSTSVGVPLRQTMGIASNSMPTKSVVKPHSQIKNVFVQAMPGPAGSTGPIGPIGPEGPEGPVGTGEEEVYATRVDFVGDTVVYRGEAAVGTSNSAPLWRIRRLTIGDGGDVAEEWANGNANFANIWDNRSLLNYI